MRLRLGVFWLSVVAASCVARPVLAQPPLPRAESPSPAAQVSSVPSGYVFDNPRLLTHQLIWGLVHGVRLLALTCRERGRDGATEAYLDWLEQQWPRVREAGVDLARYYFKRDEASTEALDAALNLKPYLDTPPQLIGPACATLSEALKQERYDLEKYYLARRQAIRKGDPDFPGAVWEEMDPPLAPMPPKAGPEVREETPAEASGKTEEESREKQ